MHRAVWFALFACSVLQGVLWVHDWYDTGGVSSDDDFSSLLQSTVRVQKVHALGKGLLADAPKHASRTSSADEAHDAARLSKAPAVDKQGALPETPAPATAPAKPKAKDLEPLDAGAKTVVWGPAASLVAFSTSSCSAPVFDFTQHSVLNRVLIPMLFVGCLSCVVMVGYFAQLRQPLFHGSINREVVDPAEGERRKDLDVARIICVFAVVLENSGLHEYARSNVFLALCWVLPFLYMTSAIAWCRSPWSLFHYSSRLLSYFVVGVLANTLADQLSGRNWHGDFMGTVFQMNYVLILLIMAVATLPLREALRFRKAGNSPAELSTTFHVSTLFWGLLTVVGILGLVCQKADSRISESTDRMLRDVGNTTNTAAAMETTVTWLHESGVSQVLDSLYICLIMVAGILFLAQVACYHGVNDQLAWLLAVHIWVPRLIAPFEGVGYMQCVELYVFAMVADAWRMKGEKAIQTAVQNYWPFLMIMFLAWATLPGVYGRCDLIPPGFLSERVRYYGGEAFLCIILVTESFKVGDPYNHIPWLTMWALYAYCFHVAWARIFPVPIGLFVTLVSMVPCYMGYGFGLLYRMKPYGPAEKMLSELDRGARNDVSNAPVRQATQKWTNWNYF